MRQRETKGAYDDVRRHVRPDGACECEARRRGLCAADAGVCGDDSFQLALPSECEPNRSDIWTTYEEEEVEHSRLDEDGHDTFSPCPLARRPDLRANSVAVLPVETRLIIAQNVVAI